MNEVGGQWSIHCTDNLKTKKTESLLFFCFLTKKINKNSASKTGFREQNKSVAPSQTLFSIFI